MLIAVVFTLLCTEIVFVILNIILSKSFCAKMHSLIPLFILNKRFILVKVAVDPEPIRSRNTFGIRHQSMAGLLIEIALSNLLEKNCDTAGTHSWCLTVSESKI